MEIPYIVTLIIYSALLISIITLGLFNIWHMVRFGMFDFSGKLNTIIFIGFTVLVLGMTALLLYNVAWLDTFTISEIINFSFSGSNNSIEI